MLLFTTFDPAMADLDEARLETLVAARLGERTELALDRYRAARPGASLIGLFGAVPQLAHFQEAAEHATE
jgi:hypothetical protein